MCIVTDCAERFTPCRAPQLPVFLCGRYRPMQPCGSCPISDCSILAAKAHLCPTSAQLHRDRTEVAQAKKHGNLLNFTIQFYLCAGVYSLFTRIFKSKPLDRSHTYRTGIDEPKAAVIGRLRH